MHSVSLNPEPSSIKDEGEVFMAVATLVTEGRFPGPPEGANPKSKDFHEGPHCTLVKGVDVNHKCDRKNILCQKYKNSRETILKLYSLNSPLCIEVLFTCACKEINNNETDNLDNAFLLEQWHFSVSPKRDTPNICFNINQLVTAIRSQLYFSQITAWLVTQDKSCRQITSGNLRYRLSTHDELLAPLKFSLTASRHEFPATDIGNGRSLSVSFLSAPRTPSIPTFDCATCSGIVLENKLDTKMELKKGLLDDRMYTSCTLKGKHRCEDIEENDSPAEKTDTCSNKRICHLHKTDKINVGMQEFCVGYVNEERDLSPTLEKRLEEAKMDLKRHKWPMDRCHNLNDLKTVPDKGQLLLDAIERSGQKSSNPNDTCCVRSQNKPSECDKFNCDMSESDIFSFKERNSFNLYVNKHCDSPIPMRQTKMRENANVDDIRTNKTGARKRITFEDKAIVVKDIEDPKVHSSQAFDIPTASEQAKFRRNFGNAASMVFHARTGLPLTSSPAPVRKGTTRFDFDSSLNSVSAIKSALFSSSFSTDDESESDGSAISPCSPEIYIGPKRDLYPVIYRRKGQSSSLLGSFEESVLNGRLEPVSTVHGFTAELGASGSFVPKHVFVPVTVFFYSFGDNDQVSSPYLGHINLGKKGYNVPKSGTVQVTLFNPLGTVVKMFVVMYDLSDMPPNSQTFIRQRTLYMPTKCKNENLEWGPKWLRYVIHLRFMSSKSGKIYLHSDIRIIVSKKSDMDTATAHGIDMSYELRSFTHMPTNPKFSPRK